jgi:mRNA-degrading endonuclease YafQ of YafQ-DinJ toxin-antitoxin module
MKNLRRAHIEKSFVLVFTFGNNLVEFLELEHHDKIYKR